MINEALLFIIAAVFNLLTFAFLLRFWMQFLRVPFQNAVGQMLIKITDFAVKPARKILPAIKQFDLSTLLLALLTQGLLLIASHLLNGQHLPNAAFLSLSALLILVKFSLEIFFYAIFAAAILSWIHPQGHPVSSLLNGFTKPILGTIRRWISPINGIDFSPFIALILLQMFNTVIFSRIESLLYSYF